MEIFSDNVLYRHKKKWFKSICKLVRVNKFSNSLTLVVNIVEPGNRKYDNIQKFVINGHFHGCSMSGETYVMFVVSKSSVEALAFKDFSIMKEWSDHIKDSLNDISQFADLVCDTSDKKSSSSNKDMDGILILSCWYLSFIKPPGCYEPKLLKMWKISDIVGYASTNARTKSDGEANQESLFTILVNERTSLNSRSSDVKVQFSCKEPQKLKDWFDRLSSQTTPTRTDHKAGPIRSDDYYHFSGGGSGIYSHAVHIPCEYYDSVLSVPSSYGGTHFNEDTIASTTDTPANHYPSIRNRRRNNIRSMSESSPDSDPVFRPMTETNVTQLLQHNTRNHPTPSRSVLISRQQSTPSYSSSAYSTFTLTRKLSTSNNYSSIMSFISQSSSPRDATNLNSFFTGIDPPPNLDSGDHRTQQVNAGETSVQSMNSCDCSASCRYGNNVGDDLCSNTRDTSAPLYTPPPLPPPFSLSASRSNYVNIEFSQLVGEITQLYTNPTTTSSNSQHDYHDEIQMKYTT